MDWYLRNEDDLLGNNNSLNPLNLFKEASEYDLFRVNNNGDILDYEIKPVDFFVEKDTTNSNSKLDSPKYHAKEKANESFLGKEFTINNKKIVFDIQKVKRSINSVTKYSTNDNIFGKEISELSKLTSHKSANDPLHMYIPFEKLPLYQRMKIKREKAKLLLKRRQAKELSQTDIITEEKNDFDVNATNIIEDDNNSNNNQQEEVNQISNTNQIKPILDKREKKILRNRISAQQSRERRKRELEELQKFSQGLIEENTMLRRELEHKNKEINWLKAQITKICGNCSKYFYSDHGSLQTFGRGNSYLKYGLFTSLLVVVCLIGSCLWDGGSENRILISGDDFKVEKGQVANNFTLPSPEVKFNEYNNYLIKPIENKELQVPPKLIDFKKFENNIESINIDLTRINKNESKLHEFLKKKRNEYVSKVKQRLFVNKKNLRKKPNLCLNNNNFFWSIQKESFNFSEIEKPHSNNYIIKSNDHNNYISEFGSSMGNESSMISVGEMMIDNQLRENIKSLLCQRPISSAGDKGFNTLLKKKIENESNDCMYMHLLLPAEGNEIENVKHNSPNKNVFYEVGCKIFEINKVYK